MKYTIERHGDGYAIYFGRDWQHHGANIGHLTEVTPETIKLIEDALNATLAQPDPEHFCDTHCVHTDHHPDCELAQPEQEPTKDMAEWRSMVVVNLLRRTSLSKHELRDLAIFFESKLPIAQPEQESYEDVVSHWHYWQAKAEEYRHKYEPPQPVQQALDKKAANAHELELDYELSKYSDIISNQDPVAWELRKGKTDRVLLEITNNRERAHNWRCGLDEVVPLYYAPPKREFIGLTDEEIQKVVYDMGTIGDLSHDEFDICHAVIAKLKEKNT